MTGLKKIIPHGTADSIGTRGPFFILTGLQAGGIMGREEVGPMDLFGRAEEKGKGQHIPLAYAMRPRDLDEFVGQEDILGPGRFLRRSIEADQLSSLIFYGPPGTGKTTLASIIAQKTASDFQKLNAVTSGVKELRGVIEVAKEKKKFYGKKTILFIDEIHRFNKSQQDALLPAVEKGIVTLIGATTENPYFEVNPPLISRSLICTLNPLSVEDILIILERALKDKERGLGQAHIEIEQRALEHLARMAGGDARRALNALELAYRTTREQGGIVSITLAVAEESIQKKAILYDKAGDHHYDTISAFIKSMRGSDPDASLYWLAKMLAAGEDPKFIARRLIIHAAEDVGMADPQALAVAVAAAQGVERIGLPEGRLLLAQATVYIATAPKSNAILKSINRAQEDVQKGDAAVPGHLKDTSYRGAGAMGHGKDYSYPHDHENGWVEQRYWPEQQEKRVYYEPTQRGFEKTIFERLKGWRGGTGNAGKNSCNGGEAGGTD